MQEIEYISCIYHTILFFVPKEVRLNSTHYFHNKRELQSIAINHSVDIDYKNFMKIYKKYTSESYLF